MTPMNPLTVTILAGVVVTAFGMFIAYFLRDLPKRLGKLEIDFAVYCERTAGMEKDINEVKTLATKIELKQDTLLEAMSNVPKRRTDRKR